MLKLRHNLRWQASAFFILLVHDMCRWQIMFYNFNMEIHDIHIMIAYCDAEWMILSRQWSREELYQYLQLQ